MQPLHIQTPLLMSQSLKNKYGQQIYFKLEALQPPGSFKLRGIGRLCQNEFVRGAKSFAASSGGNAGIAVAYSGMKLNIPTTVFIPNTSNPIYIEAIKSLGAEVIVSGATTGDAQLAAQKFAKEHHASYIHPFDHPDIWAGHATMMDEVVQQMSKPDAVIVSVGGGGLSCGVLQGMHQHGWQDVPFIAVGTLGADVFAQSVKANHPIILSSITSRATSLGATYVTPKLLEWTKIHPINTVVVSDDDAERGSRSFAKDERVLVELASGASLSLVYDNHPIIKSFHSVLVIVCGGINISHFNLDNKPS